MGDFIRQLPGVRFVAAFWVMPFSFPRSLAVLGRHEEPEQEGLRSLAGAGRQPTGEAGKAVAEAQKRP